MKFNRRLMFLFVFLPMLQGGSQGTGTKAQIEEIKNQMWVDTMAARIDSISASNEELLAGNDLMIDKIADAAERLKSKFQKIRRTDVVSAPVPVSSQTKERPTVLWKTMDKEVYWEQQRRYTDSVAQAKKDLLRWQHRGIFRKVFGVGKRYMK